jgi:hypothetical protein
MQGFHTEIKDRRMIDASPANSDQAGYNFVYSGNVKSRSHIQAKP